MVAVEQRGGGAHEAGLRIETREGPDGWTLVVLEGELDLGEAEEATRALAAAVDAAQGGLVWTSRARLPREHRGARC